MLEFSFIWVPVLDANGSLEARNRQAIDIYQLKNGHIASGNRIQNSWIQSLRISVNCSCMKCYSLISVSSRRWHALLQRVRCSSLSRVGHIFPAEVYSQVPVAAQHMRGVTTSDCHCVATVILKLWWQLLFFHFPTTKSPPGDAFLVTPPKLCYWLPLHSRTCERLKYKNTSKYFSFMRFSFNNSIIFMG